MLSGNEGEASADSWQRDLLENEYLLHVAFTVLTAGLVMPVASCKETGCAKQ